MNAKMKEANDLFSRAHTLAEEALIFEARNHMRSLPEGVECIAAMGRFMFIDDEGNDYDLPADGPLAQALVLYEAMFGQTYGPWRCTRISDVVRDW